MVSEVESRVKHYDLSFLVCVEAKDSYRAFFSMAELAPEVGKAQACPLWEIDGKPLPEKEAPCRLWVTTHQGHSRSKFGIADIHRIDGTRLANRLSIGQ